MDGASTSTDAGMRARQKRVLPARTRRGGPGLGNCEMDVMILERQKRKLEYDPLIPPETRLLLTTNSCIIEKSSKLELGMNEAANERYFDRPEVVKAYREQQLIQTPDFEEITQTPTAMSRLRPRNSEEETADISDAAYEKRHRKYETFEKRIRLREKEKLKHEQYKLKERIDQLRAMDGTAFLSLPAVSFSPIPGQHDGHSDDSRSTLPGARINGIAAHNEGERRRKEMLDVASSLEERYRILLPSDKFRKAPGPSNLNMPLEPDGVAHAELDEEPLVELAQKASEKLKQSDKLKPKTKGRGRPSKKQKKSLSPTPDPSSFIPVGGERLLGPVSPTPDIMDREPTPVSLPASPRSKVSPRSTTPISNPNITAISPSSQDVISDLEEEEEEEKRQEDSHEWPSPAIASHTASVQPRSPSAPSRASESPKTAPTLRSCKRLKPSASLPSSSSRKATRETSVPPIESISASDLRGRGRTQRQGPKEVLRHVSYAGVAGWNERTGSLLLVAAQRNSGNGVRRTARNLNMFGVALPDKHEMEDFALPTWVLPPAEREMRENR